MKEAAAEIAKLSGAVVATLMAGGTYTLNLPSGGSVDLTDKDITVVR